MKKQTKGIWVWTKYAEERAIELGLESRFEGSPASLGYRLLGQYAPTSWVEKGYVQEKL